MHGRSGMSRLRLPGLPRFPVIATALRSSSLSSGGGAWLRSWLRLAVGGRPSSPALAHPMP
eukprot:2508569-Lingulodinium_polyedra.AAC.1